MTALQKQLPSLEKLNECTKFDGRSSQNQSHGYSFEDAVCLVFDFRDEDGNLWNQYGKDIDVPATITAQSSLPEWARVDWSIKCCRWKKKIGYGTALKRFEERTKPMVHCYAGWDKVNGSKQIVYFNYSLVTPLDAKKHWGNITMPLIESIDPCINRHHSIDYSKELTKIENAKANGTYKFANCSRHAHRTSNGYEVRNLQVYVNHPPFMQDIDDGQGLWYGT